jgi:uncharacterized membrane protein
MFFVMMVLFFVFMRVAHGRRHHCAQLHYGRHRHHSVRPQVQSPQPSAFEKLKQRYVQGDLSDEQYEDALDLLLRSPETRKSVP